MEPTTTNSTRKPNVICIDAGRLRFAEKQAAKVQRTTSREQWTDWRRHALALGVQSCSVCYGLGHRAGRQGAISVCQCVYRRIFTLCLAKARQCMEGYSSMGKVDWTVAIGQARGQGATATWSLRNEEFLADFQLVSFRTLNNGKTKEQLAEEDAGPSMHWKLFALHMLLGAPWQVCCRKLGMDRGSFFHLTYRIQAALGLAFAATEPHALFPLDEYFSPITKRRVLEMPKPAAVQPKRRYCA